ncbi:jg10649 [Pararge aegeria aegeria]|uniref:Jg10649 protein n=1 Tax=Pararge aegeria aegeria TaxID=348720 RepID=A0A8S4S0Q5_9NEOP|nr:jg10649 [Pararge aegeria aegeria]
MAAVLPRRNSVTNSSNTTTWNYQVFRRKFPPALSPTLAPSQCAFCAHPTACSDEMVIPMPELDSAVHRLQCTADVPWTQRALPSECV